MPILNNYFQDNIYNTTIFKMTTLKILEQKIKKDNLDLNQFQSSQEKLQQEKQKKELEWKQFQFYLQELEYNNFPEFKKIILKNVQAFFIEDIKNNITQWYRRHIEGILYFQNLENNDDDTNVLWNKILKTINEVKSLLNDPKNHDLTEIYHYFWKLEDLYNSNLNQNKEYTEIKFKYIEDYLNLILSFKKIYKMKPTPKSWKKVNKTKIEAKMAEAKAKAEQEKAEQAEKNKPILTMFDEAEIEIAIAQAKAEQEKTKAEIEKAEQAEKNKPILTMFDEAEIEIAIAQAKAEQEKTPTQEETWEMINETEIETTIAAKEKIELETTQSWSNWLLFRS